MHRLFEKSMLFCTVLMILFFAEGYGISPTDESSLKAIQNVEEILKNPNLPEKHRKEFESWLASAIIGPKAGDLHYAKVCDGVFFNPAIETLDRIEWCNEFIAKNTVGEECYEVFENLANEANPNKKWCMEKAVTLFEFVRTSTIFMEFRTNAAEYIQKAEKCIGAFFHSNQTVLKECIEEAEMLFTIARTSTIYKVVKEALGFFSTEAAEYLQQVEVCIAAFITNDETVKKACIEKAAEFGRSNGDAAPPIQWAEMCIKSYHENNQSGKYICTTTAEHFFESLRSSTTYMNLRTEAAVYLQDAERCIGILLDLIDGTQEDKERCIEDAKKIFGLIFN